MNVLLSLTQRMCQYPQELPNDDLGADAALTYMRDAGFKLEWLEKKLDEVKEKKKKVEVSFAWLLEIEEQLQPLKHKCLDLVAQIKKKKKAKLLAAGVPLSLYDDNVV